MYKDTISITVTYNPDITDKVLKKQIELLSSICKYCVIVDNNSENSDLILSITKEYENVIFHGLDRNYGIAYALNIGISLSSSLGGSKWLLLMDQDSELTLENLTGVKISTVDLRKDPCLAGFGMNYTDVRFSRSIEANNSNSHSYVKALINSGSFFRTKIIANHKFDDSLFLYHVDTDFCLRLVTKGYALAQLNGPPMKHKGGDRIIRNDTIPIHYNLAERFFYFGRNSVIMLFRYFYFNGLTYSGLLVFENILANAEIISTFKFFFKGIWEGMKYSLNPNLKNRMVLSTDSNEQNK